MRHRRLFVRSCCLICGRHNIPPAPASGDLNSHPDRLVTLTFDLLTLELVRMSVVVRTTFLMLLRLFVVDLRANMHQTDDVTLLP